MEYWTRGDTSLLEYPVRIAVMGTDRPDPSTITSVPYILSRRISSKEDTVILAGLATETEREVIRVCIARKIPYIPILPMGTCATLARHYELLKYSNLWVSVVPPYTVYKINRTPMIYALMAELCTMAIGMQFGKKSSITEILLNLNKPVYVRNMPAAGNQILLRSGKAKKAMRIE